MRIPTGPLLAVAMGVLCPAALHAQFGAVESLLRNATDLSFYVGVGGYLPESDALTTRGNGLVSTGVELLFEVAAKERPVPGAVAPPRTDSLRLTLSSIEVDRSAGAVDSTFTYAVEEVPPRAVPMERVWTIEVGIGYGQIVGFDLADPSLDLRGSVRDLPAASVYVSHERTGLYGGLRSGFMKTQALQLIEEGTGEVLDGSAEAFFGGIVAGYAVELAAVNLFLEPSYAVRYFPSVKWSGEPALRARAPRDLSVGGWGIAAGVQLRVGRD